MRKYLSPAVIVAVSAFALNARANSLLNPGFESGTIFPDHWNAWGDGDCIWNGSDARTGAKCMQLGGAAFSLVYQRVPANPGEGYTCSAWSMYYSGDGIGQLKLEFHDAFEVKILEQRRYIYTSPIWEQHSITGVAPPGAAYVTVTVVGLGGSVVLYDDASLLLLVDDPELIVDVQARLHTFEGFGAQGWDASADTGLVYSELGLRYARVSSTAAAVFAAGMGLEIVYVRWSAPLEYMDENRELLADHVDAYATLWGDSVAALAAGGLLPAYIELSNEPDGHWNTYISPSNYNALVKLTRDELDNRGLPGVGIVGPALTYLDWEHHNATWMGALDADGVASLASWGVHSWDDGSLCYDGASCIETNWPDFGQSAGARNPLITKFVLEFATKENEFHGVVYPHPDEARDYNATNSMPYAARVYENALALLNNGARAVFVWQATDQSWETKGWGLVDLAGTPKPVYHALRTLCPLIPVGADVIDLGSQSGNVIYTGAFVRGDRLVIGLANDSAGLWQKRLRVAGATGVEVVEASACRIDHHGNPAIEDPDTAQVVPVSITVESGNRLNVALPADSTLTIVCDLAFPVGDVNRSGSVDIEDHTIIAGCLAGPGINTPPVGCTTEMFERADIDGDGDVDMGDHAVFAVVFGN